MQRKVQWNAATGRAWMAYLTAAGMEVSCQAPRCPQVMFSGCCHCLHGGSRGCYLRSTSRQRTTWAQLLHSSECCTEGSFSSCSWVSHLVLRPKVLLQASKDNSSKNDTWFPSQKRPDQPGTPTTPSKRQPAIKQGFQEKILYSGFGAIHHILAFRAITIVF